MSPDEQMRLNVQMAWLRGMLMSRIKDCGVEMFPGSDGAFTIAGLWDLLRNAERGGN